jgi:beta-galactosidase
MLSRRKFLANSTALLAASPFPVKLLARVPSPTPAANPQTAANSLATANGLLLFGVDYYPDQTPESLWEEDATRMVEFGVTNVRIAEFAWSLMEPSEGHFDFAWLKKSIDILHKHNIAVILGTPSAAPPPWLTDKYPDVVEVNEHGLTLSPGGRRFTCPTNKTYRRLSLTIATQMANTFANTSGIVGWQIDNEFTLGPFGRCYCRNCRAGFQDWLRNKYKSLDEINRLWGTVFWSQVYTDFSQIPVPLPSNGDPNPGLALDYDRYQSYANASFLEEQLAVLRKTCPTHFVTTNNIGLPFDTLDTRELFRNLDFVSNDNYPGFAAMYAATPGPDGRGALPPEAVRTIISLGHDAMRCVKHGAPFLVMEEQSGKAGQRFFSPQPFAGQLRLWSYQAVAHGAMGINYFRWDTADFGAEEYWHGVLNHDRSPSVGFDEIRQTIKELKSLGPEALHAHYVADIGLCFDYSADWALQIQPGQRSLTYGSRFAAWYGALSVTQAGIDILDSSEDIGNYRAVFAPIPYTLSAKQAANIRAYVERGGLFVTSFRAGVKDEHGQIVRTPLPGLLRDVLGVTVEDYVPIYDQNIAVKFSANGPMAGPDGSCRLWADLLKPEKATVLATYAHPAYEGKPAITINNFGKGTAVYIGADLDDVSLARTLIVLARSAKLSSPFDIPQGVELTRRKSSKTEWIFLLNQTPKTQSISLPNSFKDALSGDVVNAKVELEPYGVRVLRGN